LKNAQAGRKAAFWPMGFNNRQHGYLKKLRAIPVRLIPQHVACLLCCIIYSLQFLRMQVDVKPRINAGLKNKKGLF
jgi:hypothetical protein